MRKFSLHLSVGTNFYAVNAIFWFEENCDSFDVVEDRERLASFYSIPNLDLDFCDPSASQRSNYSNFAIDGLNCSRSAEELIQLSDWGRRNHHPDMLLRRNAHFDLIAFVRGFRL